MLNSKNYIKIILHSGFWVVLIAILNSPVLNLEWGPFSSEKNTLLVPLFYGMAINVVILYINAYWMIPIFLHRKKNKQYWSISIIILLGTSLFEVVCDVIYLFSLPEFKEEALNANPETNLSNEVIIDFMVWVGSVFIIHLFYWGLAFLYRLPNDYKRNERAKQQLIQDKLTAELEFLKAQINPHFLFNGINSIYHLIGSDDNEARKVLLQFSELLRYQLYECDEEFIPLKSELNYLKNYILLEEVRKGQDAQIQVQFPSEEELNGLNGLKIAPLLLTPFLENAFKYLSLFSKIEENQLSIQISIFKNELNFFVENTIDYSAVIKSKDKNSSGIGLENVKRRLQLLYADKYQLDVTKNNERYSVTLKINLR